MNYNVSPQDITFYYVLTENTLTYFRQNIQLFLANKSPKSLNNLLLCITVCSPTSFITCFRSSGGTSSKTLISVKLFGCGAEDKRPGEGDTLILHFDWGCLRWRCVSKIEDAVTTAS